MNSNDIQLRNRALVFEKILEDGGFTRSQLAAATNLQKGTITNIINEFSDIGIVHINEKETASKRGEKITPSLDGIYFMVIGITRKDYQIAIYSLDGKCCHHMRYIFSKGEPLEDSVSKLEKEGKELLQKYDERRVLDICLTVPGPYMKLPDGREVFAVSRFDGFNHICIRNRLETVLGRKIIVIHDAKLSAYAEWHNSPEVHKENIESLMVIRSRGYGIGCGTVIDGKIVEGQIGIAGEVGYMGINYNKTPEQGGDFEACAGTDSAIRYMRARLVEFPNTILNESSTYSDIVNAYYAKDALATWAINRLALMLGYGLANLVYVINPAVIIIGPDYPFDDRFLNDVKEGMSRYLHPLMIEHVKLRFSQLNEDSFLMGAYYFLMSQEVNDVTFFDKLKKVRKLS